MSEITLSDIIDLEQTQRDIEMLISFIKELEKDLNK
jgi:hypothetical protein